MRALKTLKLLDLGQRRLWTRSGGLGAEDANGPTLRPIGGDRSIDKTRLHLCSHRTIANSRLESARHNDINPLPRRSAVSSAMPAFRAETGSTTPRSTNSIPPAAPPFNRSTDRAHPRTIRPSRGCGSTAPARFPDRLGVLLMRRPLKLLESLVLARVARNCVCCHGTPAIAVS